MAEEANYAASYALLFVNSGVRNHMKDWRAQLNTVKKEIKRQRMIRKPLLSYFNFKDHTSAHMAWNYCSSHNAGRKGSHFRS